jgi:hypothetical protein
MGYLWLKIKEVGFSWSLTERSTVCHQQRLCQLYGVQTADQLNTLQSFLKRSKKPKVRTLVHFEHLSALPMRLVLETFTARFPVADPWRRDDETESSSHWSL